MNNTISMIVELCAEDRTRLDKLLEALTNRLTEKAAQTVVERTAVVAEKAAQAVTEMAAAVTGIAPEPETPVEVTEDLQFPEQQEIKPEDILSLVQKLAAPSVGKRDACKVIIKKYADNVSSIPADKRREVMDQLLDLAAEG